MEFILNTELVAIKRPYRMSHLSLSARWNGAGTHNIPGRIGDQRQDQIGDPVSRRPLQFARVGVRLLDCVSVRVPPSLVPGTDWTCSSRNRQGAPPPPPP